MIWSGSFVFTGFALYLNSILNTAPRAYARVHDMENWIPLTTMTEEAKRFAEVRWGVPEAAQIQEGDEYDRRELLIFLWTIDYEVALELIVSRNVTTTSPSRSVGIKEMVEGTSGDSLDKQFCFDRMLEQKKLSLDRHRELSEWLRSRPTKES